MARLAGNTPVQGIDILQHREHALAGQTLLKDAGKMRWGEVRFAKEHHDHRVRMPLADLGNPVGCVAIMERSPAQVSARHAIEAVDSLPVLPSSLPVPL